MRHVARLVLLILAVSLAACDVAVTGLDSVFSLGPPARDLPTGTVRFEPRSLSLRVGETADVTLRLAPSLKSLVLQWWGSRDFPLVRVEEDFVCEPEASCGLVRYRPAERASLQLQDSRAMRIRVTAIAPGQDGVLATVSTCVPAVVLCDDRGTDYLVVEVRP
jgi:hypothetical protein